MSDRGPWMATYSGGKFYPLDPRADEVLIREVVHALGQLCRYTGHTWRFYSVAEHSWHMSYAVPPEFALEALLHDAHEAYIGDVGRPQSATMRRISIGGSDFDHMARRVEGVVRQAFGLKPTMSPEVKAVDNRIVWDERTALFPYHTDSGWSSTGGEPLGIAQYIGFAGLSGYQLFLDRYNELTQVPRQTALPSSPSSTP